MKKYSLRRQFLQVNDIAGKLRRILFLLIIFIMWTSIGQGISTYYSPARNSIFTQIKTTTFIGGVIRDILIIYFSPRTLLLTSIPIFLFYLVRKITIHFLHNLHPSIELRIIKKFLDICAFSISKRKIDLTDKYIQKNLPHYDAIDTLGGPAIISCRQSMYLVLKTEQEQSFSLIVPDKSKPFWEYNLLYGEYIFSLVNGNDLEFDFKDLQCNIFPETNLSIGKLTFLVGTHGSKLSELDNASIPISIEDAYFLKKLNEDNGLSINNYLQNETIAFLKSRFSHVDFLSGIPQKKIIGGEISKEQHSNYGNRIIKKEKAYSGFSRKHKHSIYPFLQKQDEAVTIIPNETNNKMLLLFHDLESYLNELFIKMFKLSVINISIKEIGEINFNGKDYLITGNKKRYSK